MSRQSFNIAFGGIVSAICIALEFSVGILPIFLYVFPIICALLMSVLFEECGLKTSLCAYVGVSLLSLLICPDKEAALIYVFFFGYYPVVRAYIQKIKSGILKLAIKLSLFNISMVCAYLILIKLFGVTDSLESGAWFWVLMLITGNIVFIMFDILAGRLLVIYNKKYRGRFFGGGRRRR